MNSVTKSVLAAISGSALVIAMLAASPSHAAGKPVVIWCDSARSEIIKLWVENKAKELRDLKKVDINVVGQEDVKASLKNVTLKTAPDIIIGAHDWIGAFKANKVIVPVSLPPTARFDSKVKATLQISGLQYGVPMQTENLALFRNTKLVPRAPKTFTELEKTALKLKKKKSSGRDFIPLAVGQGNSGNAYNMYPLFSGLGGYFFGGNSIKWNTNDVGVANAKFIKNSPLIDKWYKEGLIKASVTDALALSAFTSGKAPFYITGPWNFAKVRASGVSYSITAVPSIVKGIKPVPLVGVQGAMLTTWAAKHGTSIAAKNVLKTFAGKDAQLYISDRMLRSPANLQALALYPSTGGPQTRQASLDFQRAGHGGVSMPAMTSMNAVWAAVASAWQKSTSGNSKAAPAFKSASAVVKATVKKQ